MLRFMLGLLAGFAVLSNAAIAQEAYPTRKPITLVSPYAAGGASDVLTRILAESLKKSLGQQFAVQNVTGAGGTIGSRHVAHAPPDGYTLLLHHFGMATGPFLYKNLQFDPLQSFEHIGLFAETAFVLVSGGHLFGIILEKSLGTKVTQVLYRGAAPAMLDVLANRVDLLCDSPGPVLQHLRSGNLKAFALTGSRRLTGMPEVPTVAEAGLSELTMSLWYGFYAPKGTPKPIVDRLSWVGVERGKRALHDGMTSDFPHGAGCRGGRPHPPSAQAPARAVNLYCLALINTSHLRRAGLESNLPQV